MSGRSSDGICFMGKGMTAKWRKKKEKVKKRKSRKKSEGSKVKETEKTRGRNQVKDEFIMRKKICQMKKKRK